MISWPDRGRCCYAYGDPLTHDFGFCCAKVFKKNYCEDHYKMCYQKTFKRDEKWSGTGSALVFISSTVTVQQFNVQRDGL